MLQSHKGKGHTDGMHKKQQLFQCGLDCGMFVAVNRLSNCQDSVVFKPNSPLPEAPVSIGERIVWISDKGPESGGVRWVGVLHDCKTGDLTIGVEFVSGLFVNSNPYWCRMYLNRRLRASLARDNLARASLARFSLARCQFGASHSGAFLIFAPMMTQYAMFLLRRSVVCDSLARIASARISFFAYFSFVCRIVCVISLLILSTCHRGYIIANLFIEGVFVAGPYFY